MSMHGTPSKGPIRATIPISSVLKNNSSLKPVSPTTLWWNKNRNSPDSASSGMRSPGSAVYKGKPKSNVSPSEESKSIRRTASLDTIYLKGQWPRVDTFYWHSGTLQVDKATQTDDFDAGDPRKIHCISESEENKEKFVVRAKIRTGKDSHNRHGSPSEHTLNTSSQTLSSCILSPTLKAQPVMIPLKPLSKPSIRSSVEGLNQEIERIVLKTVEWSCCQSDDSDKFLQVTPEGHRAPVAEMFRTSSRSRSVNTQTPQDFSSQSSGESEGSSPDQEPAKLGSSPQINKFLAREPPDGCEKVQSKPLKGIQLEHAPQPSTFKLKPSLGSAFQILQPSTANVKLDEDLPLVPPNSKKD